MSSNNSDEVDERVLRVGGLVLSNAFLFHEVLSRSESEVRTLRETIRSDDPVGEFLDQWDYITEEIDYAPIFNLASDVLIRLPSTPETEDSIESLVESSLEISRSRAALRHDLMGRIFHRLIGNPKYYGARYTKIPAANTLMNLAVGEMERDWSDKDDIDELKAADLACGTGTLLKSTLGAVIDRYIEECAEEGVEPETQELHTKLVEDGLWGFDVLPSAVHLAATGLALHDPRVKVDNMRIYSLPLGGENSRLGSLDFARDTRFLVQQTLMGEPAYSAERVIKENNGVDEGESVELPEFDIVTMNPPFTRNVYGSLLYGDLDDDERDDLKGELKDVRDEQGLEASLTPGIGTIFVALGDRVVKSDGMLSLVLPKTVLSGTDWDKTRNIIDDYNLRYVVSSHEPGNWNFSEETGLSETLLVAQGDSDEDGTYYVNLWEQPDSSIESLSLSNLVRDSDICELDGQGVAELKTGGRKFGEIIKAYPQSDDNTPWVLPSAFAQTELARIAHKLKDGTLYIPGEGEVGEVEFTQLNSLATLGPDGRDVYDGFNTTDSTTQYEALWGMDSEEADTLTLDTNQYLSPLSQAKSGRPLRDADTLWGRAGSLMLPKELRLNTNSVAAVTLPSKALSNVWWPTRWDGSDESTNRKMEQRLALWLNSSLGLLGMLGVRQDTEGPFVKFPKAWWESAPVLDLNSLSQEDYEALDDLWDEISDESFDPFPDLADDDTREKIDETFEEILGISNLETVRDYLAREPVVSNSPMS
jgi:hypothetical protein